MTDPAIETAFGEAVPVRDGACSRRDVGVAWGLVVVVAGVFVCLSVGAHRPSAPAAAHHLAALSVGAIAIAP
jgi:hypothetical protein